MQKRDLRSLSEQSLEELRMRAVKLRRQGHSRTASGEMLEAHRDAIGRWAADHRSGGVQALQIKKRGRKEGEKRRLSAAQEKAVQAMICEKTPDQRKLACALWTRRAVCARIARASDIRLPVGTCGEYLARWGFTPQRPARRAYEQNPPGRRGVDGADLSGHRPTWQERGRGDPLGVTKPGCAATASMDAVMRRADAPRWCGGAPGALAPAGSPR